MTITTLPEHLKPMVEKAAKAMWAIEWPGYKWPDADRASQPRDRILKEAEAGLLAFLNACLEGGVAREAIGCAVVSDWVATTGIHCDPDDFPVLILSLGEAK